MRPLKKWAVGTNGVLAEYNPYNGAKPKLCENLGDFCCYCGRQLDMIALEVDHIGAKSMTKYAALAYSWDNFLLACKNCNLAKDNKDLIGNILLPHAHNTYRAFSISPSAIVLPRTGLRRADFKLAQNTILELGFNRKPGDSDHTPADDRFKYRRQTLQLAMRYVKQFEEGGASVGTIVDLALGYGFWLVWMEVFATHQAVKQPLAAAFVGTYPDWAKPSLAR